MDYLQPILAENKEHGLAYLQARELLQQGLALVPMTRLEREQRDRLESRIQAIQAQFD